MKELIRKHMEEVESQVTELGTMTLGSDAYVETVKGISQLTKDITDLKKLELEQERMRNEHEEKMVALEQELDAQEKERKDQKVKNGLTIAGIVIPTVTAIWTTVYTWHKELDGINPSKANNKATDWLLRFGRK